MEISFTLCLPRDESSVPFVRHLIRSALRRTGVEDACVHDIELALSEACTNVLRHVTGTESLYEVGVRIDDERCRIIVSDAGGGFDHAAHGVPTVPQTAEGGRGIQLMRALVDDLEFSTEDGGTTVLLSKTLELSPSSVLRTSGSRT